MNRYVDSFVSYYRSFFGIYKQLDDFPNESSVSHPKVDEFFERLLFQQTGFIFTPDKMRQCLERELRPLFAEIICATLDSPVITVTAVILCRRGWT